MYPKEPQKSAETTHSLSSIQFSLNSQNFLAASLNLPHIGPRSLKYSKILKDVTLGLIPRCILYEAQDCFEHRKNKEQIFPTKGNLQSLCKTNYLEGIVKWNLHTKKLCVLKTKIKKNGYFTV